jgi:hypothetical protein
LNQQGIKLAYHYHLMMLVETAEEIAALDPPVKPVGLLLAKKTASQLCLSN